MHCAPSSSPAAFCVEVVGGRREARDVRVVDVHGGQATLRPVDGLPRQRAGGDRVRDPVDRDAARVAVVAVGHPARRRAVVEEVHDARDRVDPQERRDDLAPLVEDVQPLGEGAAVGPHVPAQRPHRPALVDGEGALRRRERVLAAPAVPRREQVLVTVEDVGARRPARTHGDRVVDPAVGEVARVRVRRHRRVLGVGALLQAVGRLVVARLQPEAVGHVAAPGRRVKSTGLAEEVDIGRRGLAEAVGDLHLVPAAGHDARRSRSRRRADPRVDAHERDLVVGVDLGVGVRAGERPGIRVGQLRDADRRRVVDRPEVDDSALVDLHGDLVPGVVEPAEANDGAGVGADQARDLGAGEDDRILRPLGDAPAQGERGESREREGGQSDRATHPPHRTWRACGARGASPPARCLAADRVTRLHLR